MVLLGQQHLERILTEELAKLGVKVERPVTIEDLEVTEENGDDQHVTALLKNQESGYLEAVYAKYAIGCDGSHSWVRRRFRIRFEGDTSRIGWGVIEGSIETSFDEDPQVRLLQNEHGGTLYIPREDGLSRIYVQLSDQMNSREDRQNVTLEVILEQASRNFRPFFFKAKKITWWTNYVVAISKSLSLYLTSY
ncbi:FAD-binding monooxygenase [Endogone sp. FLAS-F59071]|nr:FAD-binding monooxygenase [Endogone sp. FLAS-F59071]|eukprot:RUS17066.1 FAD-binding monooxygenase [Endogone sp. FLAS-F59071]